MGARLPAIAAAVAGVALVACTAAAQPPRLLVECSSYADFAGNVAIFREVGAPLSGVIAYLRRNQPVGLLRAALEREARRIYAEGHRQDEASQAAYRRCQERLGELEVEG